MQFKSECQRYPYFHLHSCARVRVARCVLRTTAEEHCNSAGITCNFKWLGKLNLYRVSPILGVVQLSPWILKWTKQSLPSHVILRQSVWIFNVPLLAATSFYFASSVTKSEVLMFFQSGCFFPARQGHQVYSRSCDVSLVGTCSGYPLLYSTSKGQEREAETWY